MFIRNYRQTDLMEIAELFYNTVHAVNAKDYSKEQLNVWATGNVDLDRWGSTLLEHDSLVAVEGDIIIGFGDIDKTGFLDRLYVHKDYQNQGIASALCNRLERKIQTGTITTHASITASPFFQQRGYKMMKEQQVERQGIYLTNYIMVKNK